MLKETLLYEWKDYEGKEGTQSGMAFQLSENAFKTGK